MDWIGRSYCLTFIIANMDNLTSEQRHKNMTRIKSKDTAIELLLRKELWKRGYRYRKNYNKLPGKPDIALTKYKIAIFCDGEFFHGKDWIVRKPKVMQGNNPDYWVPKIERNMERDRENDQALMFMGWTVIRFWGKDIRKNIDECIKVIEETIFTLRIEQCSQDAEDPLGTKGALLYRTDMPLRSAMLPSLLQNRNVQLSEKRN